MRSAALRASSALSGPILQRQPATAPTPVPTPVPTPAQAPPQSRFDRDLTRVPATRTYGPNELDPNRPLPVRGPNPVSCMPSCTALGALPLRGADIAAGGAQWRDQSIACLQTAGPASGATHHAEILANDRAELTSETEEHRTSIAPSEMGRRVREYRDDLVSLCSRKRREIELEYHYNIIFANDNPLRRWGRIGTEFDDVDRALAAIPENMTWGNPVAMTFRRGTIHTSSGVGGETDPTHVRDAGTASIEIFDTGMIAGARYPWASSVGPQKPQHTIRHEVGHVVEQQIPESARNELWTTLMDWQEFSWAWVSAPIAPGTPSTWVAARNTVKSMTGIAAEADFDAWLATLTDGVLVDVNSRPWSRQTRSSSPFLISWRNGAIPRIREFQYARTNQADYFAEVYNYAISLPEWLHDQLPPEQTIWFKRNVFHVPATPAEWATQLATRDTLPPSVLDRLSRLFTWTQINPVVNAALQTQPTATGGVAA